MATDDTLVRTLLIVILAILLLPFLMMALAWPMMGVWGGGHMWNGEMWDVTGGVWPWLLTWLIFLFVLVGVGYVLYRGISRSGSRTDPALEELRLAYARGELSEEEFESRRDRLKRGE